jgi:hypothetical protein
MFWKMLGSWLKELAAEIFASVMFLIGIVSNVLTFFFPGLPAPFLRTLGFSLVGLGFLLANFGVYKKLHARISALKGDIAQQASLPKPFSVSLSIEGDLEQSLRVDAKEILNVSSLEFLTTDGTCIARDPLQESGALLEIPLKEGPVRAIWNFPRNDRNTYDNSGPIKLRLTFSANGRTKNCLLPATITTKMRGSAVWPVMQGSETFSFD